MLCAQQFPQELLNDFGVIWIGSSGNDENDHPESSPAELTTSSQTEDDLYLPIEGSEPASEPAGVRMWIHGKSVISMLGIVACNYMTTFAHLMTDWLFPLDSLDVLFARLGVSLGAFSALYCGARPGGE